MSNTELCRRTYEPTVEEVRKFVHGTHKKKQIVTTHQRLFHSRGVVTENTQLLGLVCVRNKYRKMQEIHKTLST